MNEEIRLIVLGFVGRRARLIIDCLILGTKTVFLVLGHVDEFEHAIYRRAKADKWRLLDNFVTGLISFVLAVICQCFVRSVLS